MNIVDFTIYNFRSYREEQVFTLEALENDFRDENVFTVELEDGSTIKLLHGAALFGPNASGKSNLFWALRAFVHWVRKSREFPVGMPLTDERFLFDGNSEDTRLKLRFVVRHRIYTYEIAWNPQGFTLERLSFSWEGREKLVFEFIDGKLTISEGWESDTFDMSEVKMLPNHLLLSELALKPAHELSDIYLGITGISVEPIRDNVNIRDRNVSASVDILREKDSRLFMQLNRLITEADMGIQSIDMNRHGDDEFNFPDSIPDEVKRKFMDDHRWEFKAEHRMHSGASVYLPLEQESTGTQNMFNLGSVVLKALSEGSPLCYDEMDVFLHPTLFRRLIMMFNDKELNPHNAQVVFTTHNTSIVDDADGIFRTDQVWFTEKDRLGESSLYSAQDFEGISISVPFESWYRNGRFGALPKLHALGDVNDEDKK